MRRLLRQKKVGLRRQHTKGERVQDHGPSDGNGLPQAIDVNRQALPKLI